MKLPLIQEEGGPWYKEGLRFHCTGCGQCCTGPAGYVWLTPSDIDEIASFLQISKESFLRRYTRAVHGRISLLERRHLGNFDCIFLKEAKCQIYPVRPKQCRAFPWWPENLRNRAAWRKCAERCEGVDHPDAPLVSHEEIVQAGHSS